MMWMYEKEFQWVLDERTSLIVTSQRNQVANAFATISPNNMTVFFKGGVDFLESSAGSSWIDTLSTHEVSHLYQLNPKSTMGQTLKTVFGNQPMILLPIPPVPLFISPSVFLPTFILEGNATLNESRVNQGGRLFSGESLVLTNELIDSGYADLRYMMNNNLFFPFGREKYIVGGFFQSYLADKYSFPVVNRFFLHHAENNINPFDLRVSFASTFFANYEDLYSDFLKSFKKAHKNYRPYRADGMATSLQGVEFNRIGDTIYFLTLPDGKSPKHLNQFQVSTKKLSSRDTDLAMGKVYLVDGKLVTASNYSESNRDVFYTLIDENYKYNPIYKDKYVTDIEGSNFAYFDMTQSFDKGALYRNQEKIADTESKGQLDSQGNIYYFRQEEQLKVLYKNSEKLASIESFYALLAEVVNEHEIYFISSSADGSSLYCYCSGKIERVLPYDNITSAAYANDGFLISYQNGDSYKVAFLPKEKPVAQLPQTISAQANTSYRQAPPLYPNTPRITEQPKPYLSLRELRFSQYSFSLFASDKYLALLNGFSFIDPLMYSQLDLTVSISDKLAYNSLRFAYMPYATQIGFSFSNQTEFFLNDTEKLTTNGYRIGVKNTLLQKRYHSLIAGLDFESEQNSLYKNDISTAYLSYAYIESYFLNYLPYTRFSITPSVEKSGDEVSQSISLSASKMVLTDFYLSASYAHNTSEYYKLEANSTSEIFFKRGIHTPLYLASLYSAELSQGEVQMLYEIPYSKYYYRFPFSIRRLAPFLTYQKHHSKEVFFGTDIKDVNLATLGLEAELLLFHQTPVRLRLFSAEVSFDEVQEYRFGFEIKSQF